jgi:cytochrome c biogenesis protein CcmG/thiol:disulfide interchange protein DsbE
MSEGTVPGQGTASGEGDAVAAPGLRRAIFLVPLAIFLALSALFFVRLFAGDPSKLPSALIGRPAPVKEMPALVGLNRNGVPVPGLTPSLLTSGQPTIVNVWASWCAPCRQEHPLLMELAAEPGVRVVGINYKDQPENARRFLGALGNPFIAVGVDDSGRNAIEWGVYGVPETFILDGNGVIRHKHVGPLTPQTMAGFRAALAAAR